MEQLEDKTAEFNQAVIEALDEVFAALEAESVVNSGVVGTALTLGCYIEQVRHIRAAASTADMPGLNWVCSLVERNLISLHNQNRLLSKEEFSLLSEWPELLASYALNQGACKIDELIWHLGASSWPAPLLEIDADELRHLLECDPGNCCCENAQSHSLSLVPDSVIDSPVDFPADPHLAMHEALDDLIVILALDGAMEVAAHESIFSRYARQLLVLSSCAASVAVLASASDAFSQVLMLRAERTKPQQEAERNLLNLFPILAMECIAMPDDSSTGLALLDLAFDSVWNANDETGVAPDYAQSAAHMPAQLSLHTQSISHAMLALLAKEFSLMSDLLAEDLAAVLIPDLTDEARSHALGNYADVLARIGATAESLGLTALNGIFSHLHDTVSSLSEGFGPEQNASLAQLPEALLAYLAAPNEQARAGELMAIVAAPVWPNPMRKSLAEQWAADLSQVSIIDEVEQAVAPRLFANVNDISLALPKDINVELLDGLLQELPIQVASFTNAIKKFIVGNGSMADVDLAKRAAHTLKGAANTVGVAGIANLTHHLEDLLIGLTEKNALPSHALAKLLMDASDCLEAMSETVLGVGSAPQQALDVLQQVLDFIHHGDNNIDEVNSDVETLPSAQISVVQPPNEMTEPEAFASEPTQMLRVPAPVVDELLRLAGENVISNAQIQERLRQTQKQSKAIQKQDALFQKLIAELENLVDVRGLAAPRQSTVQEGDFDPLEFERYSELHTITSQLIEARTDASEMSAKIDEELNALGELLEVQRRLQMENQHAVIRTRLVPVSTLVSRLQRSVRQTCRLLDKQVELKIIGEATSIDSNMLQELTDPLMHILRNAVDHGIETPGDRIAGNKSAFGLIELSFAREGNAIVVRCKDDGAGLNYAEIRRTAMQRNMIFAGAKPTDEELGRLILMPGFSTRDTSTQTSGRGIGMDVVYSSILEMKGALKLLSHTGGGLTVELRLPATLLSEHTLMARIGGKILAVSSRHILDIHYITPDQISFIGDQQVYRVGDAVHQLLRLDNLLGIPDKRAQARELGYPILITSNDAGASCAILVQELIDGREVVVKKLGKYVPKIAGTIGAVILGDGNVAPVIDLPELLRASSQGQNTANVIKPQNQQFDQVSASARLALAARIALVVDDSLSARRAAAQIMRDAGYEVRTAIDGLDAVVMLETLVPDVILVDMEMPRMNGLELTAHVRGRAQLKKIPIIMITSRSTEKHRQQGDAAGVNAYLVKPFNEDKLLQHIDNLVGFAR